MPEQKLTAEQQVFIVTSLAHYQSPTQVADAVNEEFGVTVTRQHVQRYNPDHNPQLAKKWRDLFEEKRGEYKQKIESRPLANKAYRLDILNQVLHSALKMKNLSLAAQVLEQAAKDMADYWSAKQESDKSAAPLDSRHLAQLMLAKLLDQKMTPEAAKKALIALGVDERDLSAISDSQT